MKIKEWTTGIKGVACRKRCIPHVYT